MIAAALLLLSVVPREEVVRVEVAVIELNHCAHGWDQMIFWEEVPEGVRLQVRDFRMWGPTPKPQWRAGRWHLIWSEPEDGQLIHVTAPAFCESCTDYDPESQDRMDHPHRRLLR